MNLESHVNVQHVVQNQLKITVLALWLNESNLLLEGERG